MDKRIKNLLQQLSAEHPRYGFKKLFNLIRLLDHQWNHKRVYRNYIELGLNLRRKPKKRLAARTKQRLEQPDNLNMCWSLDFMSDALDYGKRFRTANVIDDCSREALGILATNSLPSEKITNWLDDISTWRGYPEKIRVDNGPENIARHFKSWAELHGVEIQYIQPGKPAQNGYIERFNRSYREEVLDMYLFSDLEQVQEITDEWLIHYNEVRPHESLGNVPPANIAHKLKMENSTLELR